MKLRVLEMERAAVYRAYGKHTAEASLIPRLLTSSPRMQVVFLRISTTNITHLPYQPLHSSFVYVPGECPFPFRICSSLFELPQTQSDLVVPLSWNPVGASTIMKKKYCIVELLALQAKAAIDIGQFTIYAFESKFHKVTRHESY